MLNKNHLGVYFLLALCLILVCLPRFNRRNIEGIGDAGVYILYIKYFRGIPISSPVTASVVHRPLVPFIAAFLPLDPMTSINVINIFSLLLTLVFLNLLLVHLQYPFSLQVLGSLLFIFSFPTFYYGSIGYIDPVVIFFLTLGIYFIIAEKWLFLIVLLVISAFTKETLVILIPAAFGSLLYQLYSWKKKISLFVVLSSCFFITFILIRLVNPLSGSYFWWPSKEYFFGNIGRLKNWGALLLGFGLQGFISLGAFSLFKKSIPEVKIWLAPLLTGVLMALALHFYAVISAYVDGRFIWTSSPFSIPLAIFVIDHLMKKFSPSRTQPL